MIRVPDFVHRAWAGWQQWLFEKRRPERHRALRKAVPDLAALDTARAEKSRRHAAGARAIDKRKQAVMTERLRMELAGRV